MKLVVSHCRRQTHTKVRSVHTTQLPPCSGADPRLVCLVRDVAISILGQTLKWRGACRVRSRGAVSRHHPVHRPIPPLLTNITLAIGYSAFAAAMLA